MQDKNRPNYEEKHVIYRMYVKRVLDVIISLTALIILSPLLLLISLLVRINLGKPIIFRQQRPGLNEKIFTMYKFRTMTDKRDENGKLLPDRVRLTRFGKFLRSTSLDELPELFNVLKGDMSIVGPRPLLVEYLSFYTSEEKLRHKVRPGITGLAQISGRNYLSWDKRLKKDVEYVRNCSFSLDLKICLKTVIKIISRADVAEDTSIIEGNLADFRSRANTK